ALTRVGESELAELQSGIGCEAKRAAVFELNLRSPVGSGAQLRALRDWQVDESALKAQACVFVDLDGSLHIAEADDASLRIGQSRQREQRAGSGDKNNRNDCQARRSGHGDPLEAITIRTRFLHRSCKRFNFSSRPDCRMPVSNVGPDTFVRP